MLRWTRWIFTGFVGLLVTGALAGALYQAWATKRDLNRYAPPGRLVDVGGYRLHIWCTGSGSPTVLLDSGLGGTALDWSHVQSPVAEFTTVCSYDRAGMGFSDSGPRPRTSRQIARELAMLLDKSEVRGGVILVGASIGGWNTRLFASSYPERAAGLVLVDARHEDQAERMARAGIPENPPAVAYVAPVVAHLGIARLLGIAPGQSVHSFTPAVRHYVEATRHRSSALVTAASELLNGGESATQVRNARRELMIPVVIVSAGRRSPDEADVMATLQSDQLSLSKQSCQIIAERSGHAIALGQPEIVVAAVRATVEASRNVAGVPDCPSITQRGSPLP